jgi:hypothetical protein
VDQRYSYPKLEDRQKLEFSVRRGGEREKREGERGKEEL